MVVGKAAHPRKGGPRFAAGRSAGGGDVRWVAMTLRVDEPLLSGHDAGRRSAFLQAADLGACEIDAAGRLSGCEICWRVLGWRDEARDAGSVSRLLDTIHPEDRDKAAAAIERALCEGARLEIVFRIPGPNGRTRIVGLRGSASADASSRRVLGVIADITDLRRQQDEKRRSEQRDIVVRELGHRLRNLFPVILAMVKLTAQSHCSVADYRLALERRLRALAAAERLLTRGAAESASVEELVRTEIAPFDGDNGHEIVIEGPDVTLRGGMAQSFAMIVHELATNAVKHGSLSVRHGRLRAALAAAGRARRRPLLRVHLDGAERAGAAAAVPQGLRQPGHRRKRHVAAGRARQERPVGRGLHL